MWPWEHLALGYLLYSGYSRVVHREPPPEGAAVVLAVATQFPDLVDKPLAWTLGVLPGGTTLAHSVLTAVPLGLLVLVATRRLGRPAYGEAFAVGYGSHLLGDVLYPLLTEGEFEPGVLLWPLVPQPDRDPIGLVAAFREYFGEFLAFLASSEGSWYVLFELAFGAATLLLWLADGRPGLRWLIAALPDAHRSR